MELRDDADGEEDFQNVDQTVARENTWIDFGTDQNNSASEDFKLIKATLCWIELLFANVCYLYLKS